MRPTTLDAVLGLAVFCLVGAAVAASADSLAQALAGYAFAVCSGALLLLSRTWPVGVVVAAALGIVVYYRLDLPPIGLAVPLAAALFAAAERGRAVPAGVIGAGVLALAVGVRLAEGDDPALVLGLELGSDAVLMVAVIALGDAVRSRRALRAELTRQADAAAVQRVLEAARQVEAERVRIARELHDTLGHTMSVITLQAAVADEALADTGPTGPRAAVGAIRTAAAGAMAELRATLGSLRADPAPGLADLPALVDGVTAGGLPVELRVVGSLDRVPAVVGSTAYRVVQEGLTNVLRHSGAGRVTVDVEVAAGQLRLEVVDDGVGAEEVDAGHGLRGMIERVVLLGGVVEAGGAVGGGFRVAVQLPLHPVNSYNPCNSYKNYKD